MGTEVPLDVRVNEHMTTLIMLIYLWKRSNDLQTRLEPYERHMNTVILVIQLVGEENQHIVIQRFLRPS